VTLSNQGNACAVCRNDNPGTNHDWHIVSRRYSGFDCTKTAPAEVTVQPGRFFDQGGAVYVRST